MDYSEIRKLSLKVFLGFLGLTALIAVVSVLSGDLGELQLKTIATSFTISAASICSMSCVAFIERKRRMELGLSGVVLSVVSAALVIVGMWAEMDSEGYWKTTMTFVVSAMAFAHAYLLNLPELDHRQKWIQHVSSVSIAVLAAQIVVAMWGEINFEGLYIRLLAVMAIVVGLETLCIPIVMKLQKGGIQGAKRLSLEIIEGDIYRDAAGKLYRLKEIELEQDG